MQLCESCKAQLVTPESKTSLPFPSFTVAGGIMGSAVAALSGALIVLPATLLAGAAFDAGRCDRCGEEMDESDPTYTLMDVDEDEGGEAVFTPLRQSRQQDNKKEQFGEERSPHNPLSAPRREDAWEIPPVPDSDNIEQQDQPEPARIRYRYDVGAEKLVPMDTAETEEISATEAGWSIGPGFELGDWQFTEPRPLTQSPSNACPDAAGAGELSASSEGGETI
jgi:hypothetical protein